MSGRTKILTVSALVLLLIVTTLLATRTNVSAFIYRETETPIKTVTQPATTQVSFNLPTSIKSISISDDSPASIGWTPYNQKTVLLQVSSWLDKATPYIGKIPQSQGTNVWHANIGPSELHFLASDKHQITIFPAFYIAKSGKTAISQDENGVVTNNENAKLQVQYVQDVLVFDNGEDRTYIKSEPLYNWLKTDQWKQEFYRG